MVGSATGIMWERSGWPGVVMVLGASLGLGLLVAIMGVLLLGEKLDLRQWGGIGLITA